MSRRKSHGRHTRSWRQSFHRVWSIAGSRRCASSAMPGSRSSTTISIRIPSSRRPAIPTMLRRSVILAASPLPSVHSDWKQQTVRTPPPPLADQHQNPPRRLVTPLMYSAFVSAKLKCPVRAKLKCPNYPSEDAILRFQRQPVSLATVLAATASASTQIGGQCIRYSPFPRTKCFSQTRAAVLRRTKAEVIAATASEAKKILKSRKSDLVVLCHSLSREETLEIASLAHQQTIGVPVLNVVSNADPVSEWRFIAPDSVASCDPKRLIEKVAGF
jgi:hypothetical protein